MHQDGVLSRVNTPTSIAVFQPQQSGQAVSSRHAHPDSQSPYPNLLSMYFSACWLRLKCLVCCQHIDLWSWMRALIWVSVPPFIRADFVYCFCKRRWAVLDITHTLKIAVHFAEGCCTLKRSLYRDVIGVPQSELSTFLDQW